MVSKSENEGLIPLLDTNGRARLSLMGALVCSLLVFSILLLLKAPAMAGFSNLGSGSCIDCHTTGSTGTISTAINGTAATTITASAGSSFEVDWKYSVKGSKGSVGNMVLVPTGWSISVGTNNTPSLSGWSNTWNVADGVAAGWTANCNAVLTNPNTVCYSLNYAGSAWDAGNMDTSDDDASAGDLDGVANSMGTDAIINIPAGTAPGPYTVIVAGVGHDSNSRKSKTQAITVTVSSGGSTPQSPAVAVTGPSSITYPNTGQITYSGGQGTGAMSYSSTGSTGCSVNTTSGVITVTNASGTCSVTATKAGNATYLPSTSGSFSVTLDKATPTLSVTNSPATYDGSAKSATVSGSVAGTPSSILTGGAASQTNAGTYAVTANFTPTDTNNYNSLTAASAGNFIINKATPTASVTNSPVTYDGSAKAAAVTCLGGGTASNILTGGAATQTNAGTYAVTTDCATSTNYNAATGLAAGNFVINKLTPTLSVTNSPATYDGSAKSATVSGSVAGTPSSILTGGAASQTAAGTYAVTANFTPTDTTNYNSLTAASAGNFIINQATPTASVTNSPVTYDGSAKAAAVTCLGGGTASNILTGGTATKTSAGTYAVTADCAASSNYSAASGLAAGNFVIDKATPTLTVTNSPVVYDGSAKSATVSGSVAGTPSSILTGGAASQTAVGTYAVTANFTPTDSTNYNSLTAASAGNFVISAATQTASVTNSPVIYNTAPQAAAVTCSGAGAVSNVRYNGSGTVPTNVATYAIVVDCAANGSFSATSNVAAGNFIINKATPTLSVTNSPAIYDGSAKSATVSGSVAGTPSSILTGGAASQTAAGTYAVTANFTPTDTTNYNSLTAAPAGNFVINQATPTASITNSPVTYNGSVQTATVACLGGGTATLASGGTGTNAGSYPATVNCATSTNYSAASGLAAGNFVINQAAPTASITNSPVTYNGSVQTATVACLGGGTATLASGGTGTNAGSYPATVNCAANTNYSAASGLAAGSFIINQATPTASVTNSPVTYDSSAKAAAVTCLGGGTVSNILTGGTATKTSAGTYAVTADCAASSNYSAATGLSAGSFVINKATPTLSVTNSPVVYDGSAKSATVSGSVAGTPSSILTGGAASQTAVGTYAVTANFAPTDSTNYNSLTAASAGNFVISAATQTAAVTNSPVIYNTSPQAAAVTCSGAGAVSNVRYNGSGTVPTSAATYAILVDCAANGSFSATSNVAAGNFIINTADQTIGTITFTPASLAVSGTTTVSATATSGLTVNFSSNTEAVCTVSGSTVTGVSAGTCSIKAIQAGNGNYNAAPDATQSLEVTGGSTNVTLTVTLAGTGSGTVNSVPSGAIACPGDCSEVYTSGAQVTLTATPAAMATFAGWSGGSCSGTGDCVFTIAADSSVIATFNPSPLVMLPGPVFYATIQDAYSAAAADAVLKVRNQTFSENLVFNGANVTFDGGYDATWAAGGYTTIHGDVTVTTGGVTVNKMTIE